MSALPQTMRAWTVLSGGDPKDVLKLHTDRPVPPAPRGADLLIRVGYAGLNPADVHYMRLPTWLPFRRFPTPGMDFCGQVVAAGPNAPAEFAPGAVVCGTLSVLNIALGRGTLAEYVSVSSAQVSLKPEGLSEAQAIGLGVAGQTAAIVFNYAKIKPGMRILVNGASGGVGSLLTQIAKAHGAVVFGTCSEPNLDMIRRQGVDEAIDYRAHDPLPAYLSSKLHDAPLDCIVDCVGSIALFDKSPGYLKPEGVFISIVGGATEGLFPWLKSISLPVLLGGTPRRYRILALMPSGVLANQVAQWVNDGSLKDVPIDSELAFEDLRQGFETIKSKRARGKVVIKIGP